MLRQRFDSLTRGSINRKIFGASLTILVATLAVKGVTFAKEVAVAAAFGTGDDFDAFVIAMLIPGFLVNVMSGSLGAALVPIYIDIRERRGLNDASQVLAHAVAWSSLGLAVIVAVLAMAGPYFLPYLAAGFSPPKRALAAELMWWLIPMVVAMAARTLWGAALTAAERFWHLSISAAISPALTIVLIVSTPWAGVRGMAAALALGTVAEAAWLAWLLRASGVALLPNGAADRDSMMRLVRQWLPTMASAVLMASSMLVDQSMAAALQPGSAARLEYGSRLVAVVTSLGTGVLGVAVVPYFSLLAHKGDFDGLRHVVRRWVRLTAAVALPVVAVLMLWSAPITRALYERGSFGAADTAIVAPVQAYLALQIPFYVAGIVLVRFVAALGEARVLTWVSLGNTLLNVVLNVVLIRYMGLPGIALATSLMYAASFSMLLAYASRRYSVKVL